MARYARRSATISRGWSGLSIRLVILYDSRVRIGEEVVYFSVLGAGNYSYIEEWTFRDDGTMLARAGSTGPKLGQPGDPRGHMHDFTWRLDVDLNGASGDSAIWTSHHENFVLGEDSTATDGPPRLISVEQGLVWDPKKFNTLLVQDSDAEKRQWASHIL